MVLGGERRGGAGEDGGPGRPGSREPARPSARRRPPYEGVRGEAGSESRPRALGRGAWLRGGLRACPPLPRAPNGRWPRRRPADVLVGDGQGRGQGGSSADDAHGQEARRGAGGGWIDPPGRVRGAEHRGKARGGRAAGNARHEGRGDPGGRPELCSLRSRRRRRTPYRAGALVAPCLASVPDRFALRCSSAR